MKSNHADPKARVIAFTKRNLEAANRAKCALSKRIYRATELDVEVRAGRITGHTHCADRGTASDLVAERYAHRAHVRIERLNTVAVIDDHVVAPAVVIAAVLRYEDDRSGTDCANS